MKAKAAIGGPDPDWVMKPFAGLGKFDIVFCRNVAIYFTPADKKMVFEKIS